MRVKKKDFKYVTGKKYDGMMGRCYRKTDKSYKWYGQKGIKVCSAWIKDIVNFRVWVLMELDKLGVNHEEFIRNPGKYTLDRIDSDVHYTPENCRLTNRQVQSRNVKSREKQMYESAEGEKIYA